MVKSTVVSAGVGRRSSKLARLSAGGAAARSTPAKSGTSATTTSTAAATEARSTGSATSRRRRTPPSAVGSVVDAVGRDLAAIAKVDDELARSALAALALELARQIDNVGNSATSKSMCAGQLRDTLDRLRELMPKSADKDDLDELSARRAARLASRGAAPAG